MTFKFTVIGNPIAHSKSPAIHQEYARQSGFDVIYDKTESPLKGLKSTIQTLKKKGYQGANITMPFKEEAYTLANTHSDRSNIAHAANTLRFLPDGSIYADNTDGVGLIIDIQINQKYKLENKKLLILGAGGAVRGILHPILQTRPLTVIIANRTESKAHHLAQEFAQYGNVTSASFNELDDDYDVIIDTTPFTAWPLPVLDRIFSHCSLMYDLKYSHKLTPVLEKATICGVKQCQDGFGMLVEQAAESFELWTGFKPDTAPLLENAKRI